ncbi:fungal-specific transcription factor domain-containing protein [Aspergillus transmontanensis]|uniref:Fungal-specific transcription factor domain-containing protein n=1 Tax=Aspergillus transmontanensis TaxID=1034304 RepID=A0A5N6VD40_9EURO|nr:fungal-specific transcription factor domain-containing protein [Aspergillus transmontanensis]
MATPNDELNVTHDELPPSTSKHRACDNCKLRKVRCSGRLPCQHCHRSGNPCQYSSPHGRLANAEKRLRQYRKRIQALEAAWQKYLPNINVFAVVEEMSNLDHSATACQGLSRDAEGEYTPFTPSSRPLAQPSEAEESLAPAEKPDLEDADTLEWDESADSTSVNDGIGSLSVTQHDIGYMGPQSGNALLKNLQSLHMHLFPLQEAEMTFPGQAKSTLAEDVLQSSSYSESCIDWYFGLYNCAYPVLHEGYFRAQCIGVLPKPKDESWPMLYNMVRAIGAFSGDASNHNADNFFYGIASQNLSLDLLQRGSLPLLQALTLMANYLQKRNRPNSGFAMLGMAMNMAQSIGMHREFPATSISLFEMEIRRRVWWTIYIFDSGARLTFGRPTLSLGGVNMQPPHNLNDRDLVVDMDQLPEPRDTPTVASSLIWQSKLAHISNVANMKLLESKLPPASAMLRLGNEVKEWFDSLPPYMQASSENPEYEKMEAPRMVLVWRSMHLRIIIHRPFILDLIRRRQPLDLHNLDEPPRRCVGAAQECISSIVMFWRSGRDRHRALVWYACYWLVTATFVHVACLLYDPQHECSLDWRQEVEGARLALEEMGVFEQTAARAARIINKGMDLIPTSPGSDLLAGNEATRMWLTELWNQPWADMTLLQSFNYSTQG